MSHPAGPPIFIVGCQRSGTTLLRLILDSHPNISCGPETRFLADLARITGSEWDRLSQYGFPKEYWLRKVSGFFDSFQSEYAAARGKTRWADKTPRYALSLDYLDALFPTCQVVHVIRDGRDVVASHRDRFGYRAALVAVVKWPRYISVARATGARLGPERYVEVRYEDLVTDPVASLRGLLDYLGEPYDPAVLAYDEHPHDVPAKYGNLVSSRRSAAVDGQAVYRSRVGAHRRELDPLLRTLITLLHRRTMRRLGYESRGRSVSSAGAARVPLAHDPEARTADRERVGA